MSGAGDDNPIARAVKAAKPFTTEVPANFPIFYPSDLQGKPIPARRWCVPDWIPDKAVTLLSGDGGTGKSILAMTLATCAAVGMPFMGLDIAPRKVVYLYAEDDLEEAWRRQDAINRALEIDFADLFDRLAWVSVAGEDTFLLTFDKAGHPQQTKLSRHLHAFVLKVFGAQLLIVDTIADTFGGLEIDRQQVTRFIRQHQKLAVDMDGAVLLIGHPSVSGMKDGRPASGSNAWVNAVRSALYLRRADEGETPGDSDVKRVRILERAKSNFAPTDVEIRLRYVAGVFHADHPPVETGGLWENAQVDVHFIAALRAALRNGVSPSPAKNSGQYAPTALKQYPEVKQYSRKQLEESMVRMLANRELREAIIGTGKNRRRVLAPADHPPLPDERDPTTNELKKRGEGSDE